jgi:hypothetical protein
MRLHTPYTVDGQPILGTYAASTLDDLKLVKEVGMNCVIGNRDMLNPETEVGGYLKDNGIKTLHHLTHYLYGMPALGDRVDPEQDEIPLSTRNAKPLRSPGVVQVDDELIWYTEYTPQALKGCERGCEGTDPASHDEGIILFTPDDCAREIKAVRKSPNLLGYYVLDDSPGDALSALKGMYRVIWNNDGGPDHRMVCAGYGSGGSLCNFAPDVCDMMLIYWYPVEASGYDRLMISREVQWMMTEARSRVHGMPFVGVYQAFWGDGGAVEPSPAQVRQQAEDFVREGASGLVAFACSIGKSFSGWSASKPIQDELRKIHGEVIETGGLELPPQPPEMAGARVQEIGFWEKPRTIEGLVPSAMVVGPFDDSEEAILASSFPPEDELDFEATYVGKFGPAHWIRRQTVSGWIGLGEIYGDQRQTSHCVAYATFTVESPKKQKALLKMGSDDDVLAWLDGEEVWRHEGTRGVNRDQDAVPVTLGKGENRFLLKVCNRIGMWGFVVRFTDEKGRPLGGLQFGD